MDKKKIRQLRVSSNLKHEISDAMNKLNILNISISYITMNSDLTNAKIYCISNDANCINDTDAVKSLNLNKHLIMQNIKHRLNGRYLPSIAFYPDLELRTQQRVESILQTIDI